MSRIGDDWDLDFVRFNQDFDKEFNKTRRTATGLGCLMLLIYLICFSAFIGVIVYAIQ